MARQMYRYSVWDNRTDAVVCIDCSAQDAAEAMGIQLRGFYYAIARKSKKWTITKEVTPNGIAMRNMRK